MKYLEVEDGVSVSVDKIEIIRKVGDFQTEIITPNNSYVTTLPYSTLMGILNMEEDKPQLDEKVDGMFNIMKEMGIASP